MTNQPQYQSYSPPKPNSTMAIVSLIMGILGWTFLPTLGSIIAVITGHIAKSEIKNSGGTLGGNGMATTGLILGYLALAITLCACLFLFVILPLLGYSIWNFGDQIMGIGY